MEDNSKKDTPNISGVPQEIQENIISDLEKNNIGTPPPIGKIGISVSQNEELGYLGYSNIHLRDLTIEISRHLLINNYKLVYGGDLRREGFTEIFSDLAYQYRSIGAIKNFYFENYFAFPIYCLLTRQNELEFKKNKTNIVKISPPQELGVNPDMYIPPSTEEQRFVWAKSLSNMRFQMISNTDARIVIGGKCNNYLGTLPGIIEEAKITLSKNKPLYLIGAFGGATKQIINSILGQSFTFNQSEFHHSAEYVKFKTFYNSNSQDEKIDFENNQLFFSNYGVEQISYNNGLTVEENLKLFQTPHLTEIIYYIFKGLNKILT